MGNEIKFVIKNAFFYNDILYNIGDVFFESEVNDIFDANTLAWLKKKSKLIIFDEDIPEEDPEEDPEFDPEDVEGLEEMNSKDFVEVAKYNNVESFLEYEKNNKNRVGVIKELEEILLNKNNSGN